MTGWENGSLAADVHLRARRSRRRSAGLPGVLAARPVAGRRPGGAGGAAVRGRGRALRLGVRRRLHQLPGRRPPGGGPRSGLERRRAGAGLHQPAVDAAGGHPVLGARRRLPVGHPAQPAVRAGHRAGGVAAARGPMAHGLDAAAAGHELQLHQLQHQRAGERPGAPAAGGVCPGGTAAAGPDAAAVAARRPGLAEPARPCVAGAAHAGRRWLAGLARRPQALAILPARPGAAVRLGRVRRRLLRVPQPQHRLRQAEHRTRPERADAAGVGLSGRQPAHRPAGVAAHRPGPGGPPALEGPADGVPTLAAGVALHLAYVVWIGGDFMSGRFLTAPLLLRVLLLSTVAGRHPPAAAAVALLAVLAGHRMLLPLPADAGSGGPIPVSGVVDERGFYVEFTGIAQNLRLPKYQRHPGSRTASS